MKSKLRNKKHYHRRRVNRKSSSRKIYDGLDSFQRKGTGKKPPAPLSPLLKDLHADIADSARALEEKWTNQ